MGLLTPRPDYTGAGPGTDGGGTVVRHRTVAGLPGDREPVTTLVNAHIAAVVRGVSVSVQGLMSQLEREPVGRTGRRQQCWFTVALARIASTTDDLASA